MQNFPFFSSSSFWHNSFFFLFFHSFCQFLLVGSRRPLRSGPTVIADLCNKREEVVSVLVQDKAKKKKKKKDKCKMLC